MRSAAILASCVLIAAPLVSIGSPARAEKDGVMGQAQRFLNNKGDDRDAYEQGRSDEMRRQQSAERERDRYRGDTNRDWNRDDRYPDSGSGSGYNSRR